ncbi:MAG: NusG domain II-containing protein [Clostridia bacterium]|nr:NusG domain II-containing protein [Clostridia bacterium]
MKKNDVILIGVVLILSLLSFVAINWYQNKSSDDMQVIIRHEAQEIKVFPFNENTDEVFVFVDEDADETNTIIIKDGIVTVEEANCRDQICVKTQSISKNGEIIVCLPHQLTVEIYAKSGEFELDGVAE